METGILYLVATPIGNLEDITLRALRILGEVDYVLCEDTRVTGKLLAHYEIKQSLRRYDAHASQLVADNILADLAAGKNLALVSDAGTPGVSDPGVLLVQAAREQGLRVEVVPGASAVTAAFSLAGLVGNQFTFLGFAPLKKGRQTFLKELTSYSRPVIFFESTHRIVKMLTEMAAVPELALRPLLLMRELTKLHEEVLTGTPADLLAALTTTPVKQKGEFVLVVPPALSS